MVPPLCRRGPAVGLSHASSLRSRVRETVRAVLMQMPTAAPCGFYLGNFSTRIFAERFCRFSARFAFKLEQDNWFSERFISHLPH